MSIRWLITTMFIFRPLFFCSRAKLSQSCCLCLQPSVLQGLPRLNDLYSFYWHTRASLVYSDREKTILDQSVCHFYSASFMPRLGHKGTLYCPSRNQHKTPHIIINKHYTRSRRTKYESFWPYAQFFWIYCLPWQRKNRERSFGKCNFRSLVINNTGTGTCDCKFQRLGQKPEDHY